jgi:hypothetical protein
MHYPKPPVLDANGNPPPVQYKANGKKKYPSSQFMKQPGEVRWNHQSTQVVKFDPAVDKVPGNPQWLS